MKRMRSLDWNNFDNFGHSLSKFVNWGFIETNPYFRDQIEVYPFFSSSLFFFSKKKKQILCQSIYVSSYMVQYLLLHGSYVTVRERQTDLERERTGWPQQWKLCSDSSHLSPSEWLSVISSFWSFLSLTSLDYLIWSRVVVSDFDWNLKPTWPDIITAEIIIYFFSCKSCFLNEIH